MSDDITIFASPEEFIIQIGMADARAVVVKLPDGRKGSWSVEEFVALLEGAGAFGGPFAGMTFQAWQEPRTGFAYLRTTDGVTVAEAWSTQGVVYVPGADDIAVEGGDLETVKQRIVGELRSRGAKL